MIFIDEYRFSLYGLLLDSFIQLTHSSLASRFHMEILKIRLFSILNVQTFKF